MELKNKAKINKETLLVIVGFLLLIISFLLFHYTKILEVNNEIYNNIQTEIFKEKNSINSDNISVDIDVDYIEKNHEKSKEEPKTPNYIAFLEIDKINLKQGLLNITSYYNNVNYHVQILSISDFPDKVGGNFILAGHSGTSNIAFFKDLYKLNLGDIAKVYYKSNVYKYKIVNIYKENKDGSVNIYRNNKKTILTLITCTRNDKNTQTIYIAELIGAESF